MANSDEKVSKFVQAITDYAEEQRQKIHQEVEDYKIERLTQAEQEVLADAYDLIQRERMELKNNASREMSRRELAENVGIDPRYLANIELCGTIPSVPVVMQLIRICKLPAERYFNPELLREDSEQRQRTSHKLQLCPEKYLPIVEGVIDGAIKLKVADDEKEDV